MKNETAKHLVTIFTIPKPFIGLIGIIQRNAIQSWITRSARPDVILLGSEEGVAGIAQEFGLRHVPDIKVNEFGTPLIDFAFETAQRLSNSDLMAYVNADIILLDSFFNNLDYLSLLDHSALMVGRRHDLMMWEPVDFSNPEWSQLIEKEALHNGLLDASSGIDYFVFKKGLYQNIPPFAVGRTYWDNWLLWYAKRFGSALIDATRRIMIVHQEHPYTHKKGGVKEIWNGIEAQRNYLLSQGCSATINDSTHCLDDQGIVPIYESYRLPETMLQDVFDFKYRQSVEAYFRGEYEIALDLLEYIRLWARDNIIPEGYRPHLSKVLLALGEPVGNKGQNEKLPNNLILETALQDARKEARQGKIDRAVEIILRQAISVNSQSPLPYVELAELLVSAKRYEDAMQVLPEVPENTDRIWMCEIAAICHAALGEEQQAEAAAMAVLQQKGDRARPLEVLGMLAARRGTIAAAYEFLQRAATADSCRGEALLALGMLTWNSGELEAGYQLFRQSLVLSPLNADAASILHDAARRLSHLSEFVDLMHDLLSQFPDVRHLIMAFSEALAESGQIKLALAQLEDGIVRIGCDDELLDKALDLRKQCGPHRGSRFGGLPAVSLCMIVRDECTNLQHCLSSTRPVVDEIIIVDTGSIDRTADVATVFGAKVYHYTWANDFSAARNFALAQATGELVFVLDADEVLSESDFQRFAQTLQSSAGKMVAWSVTTRNYSNRPESEGWLTNDGTGGEREQGDGWYPSCKVRLFPNSSLIRFHGDIHEMVEPDLRHHGIPIEHADFVVHHYGELDEKDQKAKQLRYYQMGKTKLAGRPNDQVALAELALQAGQLGFFEEAIEYWDRLLASGAAVRDVYFNRSYALMGLHRYADALASAEKALELDPDHKESQLNAALCELHTGNSESACQRVDSLSDQHREWPLLTALRLALTVISGESRTASACHADLCRQGYGVDAYLEQLQNSLILAGQPIFAGQLAIWVKGVSRSGM